MLPRCQSDDDVRLRPEWEGGRCLGLTNYSNGRLDTSDLGVRDLCLSKEVVVTMMTSDGPTTLAQLVYSKPSS